MSVLMVRCVSGYRDPDISHIGVTAQGRAEYHGLDIAKIHFFWVPSLIFIAVTIELESI